MPLEMIKVLSIEDNPGDARLIREMLHEATALGWDLPQFELTWVNTLSDGLARLDQGDVDVILSDLDLPDSQAGDTFARLRAHSPWVPIIVLTGREDEALARHTVRAGADDYLFKREMNGSLLAHALLYALERQRAKLTLQKAHQDLERRVEERTAELEQVNARLRREIVERQRAESQQETALEALRESERRYRELFENSRDGFVVVDAQGRFLDANRAYCDMLGYTLDELGQKADFYEVTPARWREWERTEIWEKRLLQEGYSGIYQKEYIRKDGTVFPVELQSYTVLDEQGQPRYLWGIARDISARMQNASQKEAALEALRAERDRAQRYLDIAGVIFIALDEEGQVTLVNQKGSEILGYAQSEIVGQNWFDNFVPARIRDQTRSVFKQLMVGELAPVEYHENPILTPRGKERMIAWHNTILKDEAGNPVGILGSGEDITERVRAEEKVAHLNRVLKAIRNVNQLIVREKDRDALVQGACDHLVATRGYHNAWIVLFDHQGARLDGSTSSPQRGSASSPQRPSEEPAKEADQESIVIVAAGLGRNFSPLFEQLKRGVLTACGRRALAQAGAIVTPDPCATCSDCPLANSYADRGAMTVRLAHGDKIYGVLCASIPAHLITDQDEQVLFREVADDLAFSLHKIQTQKELHRFKHIISTLPQPMSFVSRDYRYLAVNDVYAEFYDTEREQILGRKVEDFCGPEVFETEIQPHLDRCLAGETVHYQVRVDFASKGWRWMEMAYYPYHDERGNISGVVSHGLDVTERVRAEAQRASALEKLRASEEKYRLLAEATSDIIVLHDIKGRIVYLNQAGLVFAGFERSEAIGQPISAFIPAEHRDSLAARRAQRVAGDKGTYRYQTEFVNRAGQRIPVEVDSTPLLRYGRVREILVVARDITARLQAEAQLRHYAAELERSNQELQQFAHVASHDLQEPLRTIGSFARLLSKRYWGQLDEQADQFVNFIVEGVERMQALLHNLLIYSRVDSEGRQPTPTDSQAALQHALSALRTAIAESGAEITHDPLPTVWVDKVQITQLLQNLVGNAIKFRGDTPARVHVSAEREAGMWTFAVRDNGIGIDFPHHEQIFEPFRRLHTRDEYPGTGMGLAICAKIVARHGGRIWVDSTPGQGATFYFTLPEEPRDGQPLQLG